MDPERIVDPTDAWTGGGRRLRLLAPYSGLHGSEAGLEAAVRWTGELDAELWVLHLRVADPIGLGGCVFLESRREARALANTAVARVRELGASASALVRDVPRALLARGIVSAATELDIDCIVLTSRRRASWAAVLLGSTSRSVARRASCGVLVVAPPP